MVPALRYDYVLQIRQLLAHRKQGNQLIASGDEDHAGLRMVEDIRHAFRRFFEVNRNRDRAAPGDRKIRGGPPRTIRGEKADTVAGLHSKFEECLRQTRNATKKLLAGNVAPRR